MAQNIPLAPKPDAKADTDAKSGPRIRSNEAEGKKPKKTADGTAVMPRPDPKTLAAAIADARRSREVAAQAPPSYVLHAPPRAMPAPVAVRRRAEDAPREATLRMPAALALVAIVAFVGGAVTIGVHMRSRAPLPPVTAAVVATSNDPTAESPVPIVVTPAPTLEAPSSPPKTVAAKPAPAIYKPKHGLPNPADFVDSEPVR